MPHLIVEYPAQLVAEAEVGQMVEGLYHAAAACGLFDPSHIRIRAIPFTHYLMAGEHDPFVHLQCRIHTGRSEGEKRQLSEALLAAIRALELSLQSITVEVVEMERASYARYRHGKE